MVKFSGYFVKFSGYLVKFLEYFVIFFRFFGKISSIFGKRINYDVFQKYVSVKHLINRYPDPDHELAGHASEKGNGDIVSSEEGINRKSEI